MSPRKRKAINADDIRKLLPLFIGVLSPKQQLFLQEHYYQGLSLAEVARRHGVSRQAVLDAVSHGEKKLLKLGSCLEPRSVCQHESTLADVKNALQALRDRIAREGIIYSPRWIVEELEALLQRLETASERHNP